MAEVNQPVNSNKTGTLRRWEILKPISKSKYIYLLFANMAEIEARLVGMIQAPTRKFTQFRMKNFKNRHSFFGKSFLFFSLLCVKSGFITPPGN